jgi:DNA polymerase-3 subunit gamma/tau
LQLIAKHAEGGMRDALSLLEQCVAHSDGVLSEVDVRAILGLIDQEEIQKLAQAVKNQKTQEALQILEEVCLDGKDLFQFGHSLVEYFRGELLSSLAANQAGDFTATELIEIIQMLAGATNEVKKSFQNALPLELALIKLTTKTAHQDEILARLERLEQTVATLQNSGIAVSPVPKVEPEVSRKRDISKASTEPVMETASVAPVLSHPDQANFDWEQFLETVKQKKRTVGALIQEGKPVSFDGAQLVVEFPANLKFHIENLALPQNRNC